MSSGSSVPDIQGSDGTPAWTLWLPDARRGITAYIEASGEARLIGHAADLAHMGGLAGLNEHETLVMLRRLTVGVWDKSGTDVEHCKRVFAAIEAASEGK